MRGRRRDPDVGCSTTFSAVQFALYTGVSELFVVGCDVHGGYSASAKNEDVSAAKVGEVPCCCIFNPGAYNRFLLSST